MSIGRERRGLVVTVFFDPKNSQESTKSKLENLEIGVYGSFFGR